MSSIEVKIESGGGKSEGGKSEGGKLWGGRFTGDTDPIMERFNCSINCDKRLWREDIQGSKAYVKAIHKVNLVTKEELDKILSALDQISSEWENKKFVIDTHDEDIHSANERRLKELVGADVGGKLHTGRSRNDQVVTDVQLWMKSSFNQLKRHLTDLIHVFITRAASDIDILIPGYTHLQRAQPVRWSHWLLSYAWSLLRDCIRLKEIISHIDVCPLGSGAIAGNPFGIDRESLAKDLGFSKASENSMDSVSHRDYIVEFLFWSSLVGTHLSRWAEDFIIYSTKEFNFIDLADAYSTGSSLMPQKKNPDSLELIRGKAGRLFGQCSGFMMSMKGLPSTYNKDLQDDKVALFDSYDTLSDIIQIAAGVLSTVQVNEWSCTNALTSDMLATDLAYYLVRKGVAFREAHSTAGQCVALAEKNRISLDKLSVAQLKSVSVLFEEDCLKLWDFSHSVEQYQAVGGTSRGSVISQIDQLKQAIYKL